VRTLALLQGLYFLVTGIWPLINIGSFQAVTGPKTDLWLVKTVGSLIAVIGLVVLAAGVRDNVTLEVLVLAVGSSAVLMAVDVNYSLKDVISKIYLADAAVEAILIFLWFTSLI
jgi:hypothetical protein